MGGCCQRQRRGGTCEYGYRRMARHRKSKFHQKFLREPGSDSVVAIGYGSRPIYHIMICQSNEIMTACKRATGPAQAEGLPHAALNRCARRGSPHTERTATARRP